MAWAACLLALALPAVADGARNVTIDDAPTFGGAWVDGLELSVFTPDADDAVVNTGEIASRLDGGSDVEINTGSDGTQPGDITVADSVSWSTENTLALIANHDIVVNAEITLIGGGATLVSDAADGVGPGGVTIGAGAELTATSGAFAIYTARQEQNEIDPTAQINGATFTPGAEFVDTEREVWGITFPEGTASAPFTILYEEAAPSAPPPPPVPDPEPETTITKKPRNTLKTRIGVTRKKVTYEFSSSIRGSSFTCTLDGKSAPCTVPFKKRVKKGRHTFSVVATSPAGKADPTPAEDTFRIKRRRR